MRMKAGPGFVIRAATAGDVRAMGEVHVASWRETYAGVMPDPVLAGLSVERRTEWWRNILTRPEDFAGTSVFLAERDGELIGFSSCGEQRSPELSGRGFTGEITAIYVLRAAQRKGAGSVLMAAVAQALLDRGHQAAGLWLLRKNTPARRFYERLGGQPVGQREADESGTTLVEIAYGWRDLNRLLSSV